MSNTLRIYETSDSYDGRPMSVTAFVGGKYGRSVQFTIDGKYCALAENQVRDLIKVLRGRVNLTTKYCATSSNLETWVMPEEVELTDET